MSKRLVICSDGTWNRPEETIGKKKKKGNDYPTNVLRMARSIKPLADDGVTQQVFYDWGVGAYGGSVSELFDGATGNGLHKNVMDAYRYIVQNYSPDDDLIFIGFSRGAYTVRSLCGLINNCGILKRDDANLIQKAFNHYKTKDKKYHVNGEESKKFRNNYSHPNSQRIKFVGVWDTVGAMGIPFGLLGLFGGKDEFYDNRMGSNIEVARHALALDEKRDDFEPTIWMPKTGVDLKQVWFIGVHSDVGGSYPPDEDNSVLSAIPLQWIMGEIVNATGLSIEGHIHGDTTPNHLATKP